MLRSCKSKNFLPLVSFFDFSSYRTTIFDLCFLFFTCAFYILQSFDFLVDCGTRALITRPVAWYALQRIICVTWSFLSRYFHHTLTCVPSSSWFGLVSLYGHLSMMLSVSFVS